MAVLDLTDGTTTINLLNYLRRDGWKPVGESIDWDLFELADAADAAATIRAAVIDIGQLLTKARKYRADNLSSTPVRLVYQSDGESAKQSFVLDGGVASSGENRQGPLLKDGAGLYYSLALQRTPYFENTTVTTLSATNRSAAGGVWAANSPAGEVDQRIKKLTITPSAELHKVWLGMRRYRNYASGFNPVWECESSSGATYASGTSQVADGGASGGTKVRVTAGATTLEYRFVTSLQEHQVTGPWDGYIGEYLILGRVKLASATDEVRVQLRAGTVYSSAINSATPVGDTYLSAISDSSLTGWSLVELGTVRIPMSSNRDGIGEDGSLRSFGLMFYVEFLDPASIIDFDCIYLIPREGLMTVSQAGWGPGFLSSYLEVLTSPLDEQTGHLVYPTSPVTRLAIPTSVEGWQWPYDGGIFVFAGQAAAHSLGVTATIAMDLLPRWRMFRE